MERKSWGRKVTGKLRRSLKPPNADPAQHGPSRSRTPSPRIETQLLGDSLIEDGEYLLVEKRNGRPPSYTSVDRNALDVESLRIQEAHLGPESELPQLSANESYDDTKRTIDRYHGALKELKDALNLNPTWGGPVALAFENVDDNNPIGLREEINKLYRSQQITRENRSRWDKYKVLTERIYRAVSPFMKTIAQLGSDQVNPYGIAFQGVFMLLKIADRHLDRRAGIENQLDYISRQLGQLQIVDDLPTVTISSRTLLNSAIDVRAAIMNYLALQIRRESNRSGFLGKMAMTLQTSDEDLQAQRNLESSIQLFNAALSHFGHGVTFKTHEQVTSIREDLTTLLHTTIPQPTSPEITRETFIVPYEVNPHFTGRKELLRTLHTKLHENTPQTYNHRIALHGLGGVGKTQTALSYVYTHKQHYPGGIYWLSGVSQASLLSSYADLGRRVGVLRRSSMETTPEDIARVVLGWLKGQENWLVVIDNLDDVKAVGGFLPPVGEGGYTILTTRNPNVLEIPAKGVEVGILAVQEAIELLVVRANLAAGDESVDEEAERIVTELGCLPLAIEQASAFIRETSRNIFKFLPSYRNDRKRIHRRMPRGNWEYSKAVATTWGMSFEEVEMNSRDASELLRLLAFLNPDGILLEFLIAGKDGLEGGLRGLIDDEDLLYEALGELERFSLIRRQDGEEEKITIHRLVQSVVKDDMDESDFSVMTESLIKLCDAAFPNDWEKEHRALCRKYQGQVVPALTDVKPFPSADFKNILSRLGRFLHEDGKYREAEGIRSKALEVATLLHGSDNPSTLDIMSRLAETFREQSKREDAIELQEKVAQKRAIVLGDDHLDTWTARGDLAASYRSVRRREEAEKIQLEVLDARVRLLGEEHPDTLRAMGNLAATYRKQKRSYEALGLQEKVLRKRLASLGEEHPDTLSAKLNVAITLKYLENSDRRKLERASRLEEQVIEARKKILGAEHPQTLTAMRNLSDSMIAQNRWKDAGDLLEAVVEGRRRELGDDAVDTLWAMANLGAAYRHQNRLEEAAELQEKVLEGRRRVFGDDHIDVRKAMHQLAKTYYLQGRKEESEELSLKVESLKTHARLTKVESK